MRPIVLDKCVTFRDPGLNHSREIPPEPVGGSIFDSFFTFRPEADNNVMSGVAVDYVRMDVPVKFGDLGEMVGAGFVSNETTNEHRSLSDSETPHMRFA